MTKLFLFLRFQISIDFQFFLRDVICCLFHVDGNSIVAGTGQPWRCRGSLDGGCETGTRLGYGAFRGRNATIFFFLCWGAFLGSKMRFTSTSTKHTNGNAHRGVWE
jgi:hypothetical protein